MKFKRLLVKRTLTLSSETIRKSQLRINSEDFIKLFGTASFVADFDHVPFVPNPQTRVVYTYRGPNIELGFFNEDDYLLFLMTYSVEDKA